MPPGMLSSPPVSWNRIVAQALLAGIAGAVAIDLYLWLTPLVPHPTGIDAIWRWIASTVLGKAALTQPQSAWAGVTIHVLVSIGWAGGYAYVAATRPATTRNWLVAGIVYGLIVYVIMQAILLADNNFIFPPTPNAFVSAVIAHTIFFGLPVAYVVHVLQVRNPA